MFKQTSANIDVTLHFIQNQFCVFSDVSWFKNYNNNEEENNDKVDDYGHNDYDDDDLLPSALGI